MKKKSQSKSNELRKTKDKLKTQLIKQSVSKSIKHSKDSDIAHASSLGPLLTLSQKIEASFNLETFPDDAFKALEQLNLELSFQDFESAIGQWLLDLPELPNQVNLYNAFGEPSISLFNNDKFSVDVYFWRTNDTVIHSHGFRGAFKVLFGQSLHEEFNVETTNNLTRQSALNLISVQAAHPADSDVLSSKIMKSKIEILKTGDTRTILPGMDLVHRVLHLDNPTVTLCIRTVNDKALSQWHHLSSGISYQQRNLEELTIKQILYVQFLFESNPANAKNYLNEMLGLISVATQLAVYEGLFHDEFGLDPETTYFMIDHMRTRFEDLKWFGQYESHYKKMTQSLFEVHASTGSLKLLAHGINSGYSVEEIKQLLKSITKEDLSSLCQKLLSEDPIFNEEHYDLQQETIINFAKGVADPKSKSSRKVVHEH